MSRNEECVTDRRSTSFICTCVLVCVHVCVNVCVCARVRACVRACVRALAGERAWGCVRVDEREKVLICFFVSRNFVFSKSFFLV